MRLCRPEIRHARVWALLVPVVLLMHAAVLGGIDSAGSARPVKPVPVVQVRSIAAPQAAAPAAPDPLTPAPATTVARPLQRAVSAHAAAPAPQPDTALIRISTPATEPVALSSPPSPPPSTDENTVPVYPTVLPPPATLRYDLRRGALSGRGELRWHPAASAYTLQLDGSVAGLTVLTQISQGGIDAAGLAPLRLTDQRARRAPQAANFQRDAGKITFSGPSLELPLVAGVQDRLSWMIQLAAIAAAAPARWLPGEHLVLQVVGARGDAGVWSFRSLGVEPLQIAGQTLPTLHLLRESRGPHDTVVDVWLDPARHHLPVRAHLRNGNGDSDGDGFELRLRDLQLAP